MGFINLRRLNSRKRNSCAGALVSLSDVQPPSIYKSNILNGPINKLYITEKASEKATTNTYNNLKDPEQKGRLGNASHEITGGLKMVIIADLQ